MRASSGIGFLCGRNTCRTGPDRTEPEPLRERRRRSATIGAVMVLASGAVWQASAQEDAPAAGDAAAEGTEIDFDAMFDEEIIEEPETSISDAEGDGATELVDPLQAAEVRWGGRFDFGLDGAWRWDRYEDVGTAAADSETLAADAAATLFFDARASETFRVFGKAKVDYVPDPDDPAGEAFLFDTQIFELFSDFQWGDWVFFRAGKQRADWGVGRFFSPADLISLVTIDPNEPDAEREGPVAVKAQAPIGVHNAYLYLLTDALQEPLDLGVAARAEVVVGSVEIGFGGLLQDALVPKGIVTATAALGDFDLFGELLIQRGTERNLITEPGTLPADVVAAEDRDDWFLSATVGATYLTTDPNLIVTAQYYYNPLGYPDSELRDEALALSLLLPDPPIVPLDILFFGTHYAAAAVSWSDIADTDLSTSVSWVGNLSDGSGTVSPSLSWRLLDEVVASVGGAIGYGEAPDETVESVSLTASLSLGSGGF